MNPSVSTRPLSLVPFLAADAVLLAVALLIAWRTPDELAGGALLGVVVCTVLGAVLAVLPFVLNDAREREAALAERQRELVELVNTASAHASRWGTQWAAAATGLDDAAGLASRSIASAERLPAVFEEKAAALVQRLEQAELEARARHEKAVQQESAHLTRCAGEAEARMVETAAALTARLAEVESRLTAFLTQLEERAAAVPPVPAAPVVEALVEPAVAVAPIVEIVAAPVPVEEKKPARSETIMDPFLIPDDGYAILAEAMDIGRA